MNNASGLVLTISEINNPSWRPVPALTGVGAVSEHCAFAAGASTRVSCSPAVTRFLRRAGFEPASAAAWLEQLRPVRNLLCCLLAACIWLSESVVAAPADAPWMPDLGDGRYRNPVLAADYSDPDVVRVGEDYYLTSSSFTNIPGLPILHSKDLVNWTIIGHALQRQPPYAHHGVARRGGGVWAPAIRHHDGRFYIYYPDPDFGIYVVTATNPAGPWTQPKLIDTSRGAIDPCPFWDEDGSAWLIMAWAKSRAGFNNVLTLKRMSADGLNVLDAGTVVVDGNKLHPAATSNGAMSWEPIEGPKLHKKGGWYYIFAPAGGVKAGWQAVFRSRRIGGPYTARNVMDQGKSEINGPHQGAWVRTQNGEDWFLHFQDTDSYGRRVHLQPMMWKRDWPVIGVDANGDGRGEPVAIYRKPDVRRSEARAVPQTSDEFDGAMSLAWQWHANPQDDWMSLQAAPGWLRLKSISSSVNLYEAGHLLTQKLPGPGFSVTTRLNFVPRAIGEQAGLVIVGYDYAWIGLRKTAQGLRLMQNVRKGARDQQPEIEVASKELSDGGIYLRLRGEPITVPVPPERSPHWPAELHATHAQVHFSYSIDGENFVPFGEGFVTQPGKWVGTVFGVFAQAPSGTPSNVATAVGYADFDWFHVTR